MGSRLQRDARRSRPADSVAGRPLAITSTGSFLDFGSVHLAIIILVVNSARLEGLMHRRSVILISPQDLMKQKELTYLELPPDEQKVSKRPDTNKISDKDRIATSKAPQLDRKELKKILDSARPGAPGQSGPPVQQPAPARSAARGRKRRRSSHRRSLRRSRTGGAPADAARRTAYTQLQHRSDVSGIGH